MRALIAGAGGMLGQAVAVACRNRGHEVVAYRHAELDIADPRAVEAAVRKTKPDVVVNCAAWTDVDGAEENERAAMRLNDEAAAQLAAAAASVGASYLLPSTDYVFDGAKRSPYVESDLPAPLSAYGRSKLAGETSVAVVNGEHFIVRTAWLFGAGGSNFVDTMLRLGSEQSEVLVVSDQVGSPTYAGHLGPAIAELIEGEAFGIHHIAGAGACSWYELAQEVFDLGGVDCHVMSATSELMARPAPRPAYSALDSEREDTVRLGDWREGVEAYLSQRVPR